MCGIECTDLSAAGAAWGDVAADGAARCGGVRRSATDATPQWPTKDVPTLPPTWKQHYLNEIKKEKRQKNILYAFGYLPTGHWATLNALPRLT